MLRQSSRHLDQLKFQHVNRQDNALLSKTKKSRWTKYLDVIVQKLAVSRCTANASKKVVCAEATVNVSAVEIQTKISKRSKRHAMQSWKETQTLSNRSFKGSNIGKDVPVRSQDARKHIANATSWKYSATIFASVKDAWTNTRQLQKSQKEGEGDSDIVRINFQQYALGFWGFGA